MAGTGTRPPQRFDKLPEGALISAELDGTTIIAAVTMHSEAVILASNTPLADKRIGTNVSLSVLQKVKVLASTPDEAIALMRQATAAKNS